jgi:2-polyprenyl-3-methyl-5-hydroxy-6-metoxy-1,4-benzoquinol methylase
MELEEIKHRKKMLEERYGRWSAHNIHLGGDIYTIDNKVVGDEYQLRRVMQIFSDVSWNALGDVRALDLGCLEGLYAIELARRGARVVAIEGREANIQKTRFAKEVLALNNLELIQDGVCNLSKERHGCFDIVLCSGILYHLDVPHVFSFLERIAEVCQGFTVIDTHVGRAEKEFTYKNKKYWGEQVQEHSPAASPATKAKELWKSLTNPMSFLFTRPSLYNCLAHVGFTSVYETHYPREVFSYSSERVNLVAIKGKHEEVLTMPLINCHPEKDWPEQQAENVQPASRGGLKAIVKKLLGKQ